MFWPWPPMHVDAHTTLYTLHSIPYTALLGPIPIFSSSSIAFLMCWPSPLMHVKDRPDLTLHSLHSSTPTFTLQTPVLNLTPIFSSYSSSSIAFLLFWPPQCTSMDGPGGNRTPPSPNCHLVHWPQNRPRWPPQMVGELPQIGHSRHDCPRPPILTSFAMSNFSQAWQLAFVKSFSPLSMSMLRLEKGGNDSQPLRTCEHGAPMVSRMKPSLMLVSSFEPCLNMASCSPNTIPS